MKNMRKKICILLAICLCLSICACGNSQGYGVRAVATLVEQDYILAFRTGDITVFYVSAALQVLNAQGKIDELNRKWFGSYPVTFEKDAEALNKTGMPEPRNFVVGIDLDSFPFAYKDANGAYWGFDVELAMAVCELLDWQLSLQPIETVDAYVELSSGNIDCAWGGIALDQKMVDEGKYDLKKTFEDFRHANYAPQCTGKPSTVRAGIVRSRRKNAPRCILDLCASFYRL